MRIHQPTLPQARQPCRHGGSRLFAYMHAKQDGIHRAEICRSEMTVVKVSAWPCVFQISLCGCRSYLSDSPIADSSVWYGASRGRVIRPSLAGSVEVEGRRHDGAGRGA